MIRHLITWKNVHVADVELPHTQDWACDIFFRSIALRNELKVSHIRELNNTLFTNLAGGFSQNIVDELSNVLLQYLHEFYGKNYRREDITVVTSFSLGYFPETSHRDIGPHDHRAVHFTIVFYANFVPHEGDLKIWNPWSWDGDGIIYEPKNLRALIMPGNVPHNMMPHQNTQPRVCVVTQFKVANMPLFGAPCGRFMDEQNHDGLIERY
ncbi:MAG: hypothetical protein P4M08_10255 [Oligoflexia bacterium]|nr:hypothetical protein [Oligoflexia bacterium]